ncbi:MAG: hypothetical protein AAF901_06255, partial [Bacteroidota bacterium]
MITPFLPKLFTTTNLKPIILSLCVFLVWSNHAQENISELLKLHNTESVPYISVNELNDLN